jgi:hypothetical protein
MRDIAKQYIDNGWAVVPLEHGQKRASTSWQKQTYSPQNFGEQDGIAGKCGEPSGWRVDVDLDSIEAIQAAKLLLPNTGLIHGRPGKPDSHYWFLCDGIKTHQFKDIIGSDGKTSMLVEVRSTGGYTALPPSVHPSGEHLAWVIERDPMRMLPDDLWAAVRNVAIAALLARHWPGSGARHSAAGNLAGFLSHAGIDSPTVIEIIKAAATIAHDPDVHDRINFATATVAKFRAGEPITGGPKLIEEFGEQVVARMRGWLKLADLDAIEEMNLKHFWVRMGKDDVIGREDDDHVVFQKVRALYSEYANRKVKVGEDEKGHEKFLPLFQAWLEHKSRRSYRKVSFAPPPRTCAPEDYNLWKGYAIDPAAGDCQLFLEHLYEVICSENAEHFEYLLNLLALTIQEPGTPSEVATVLRGEPGTGKGTFVRALGKIFGRHFIHLDNVKHLVGFNAAISGKVIVFADEAFWAGDKRELGALKRLITEPTLTIERKGIDATTEPNFIHLFMATNEEWAIPAMLRERRFFALQVSSKRMGQHDYFNRLEEHLRDGGLAAFVDLMMRRPVDRVLVRNVPKTKELRVQQNQSLALELRWWQEVLHDATVAWFGDWTPVADIYAAYEQWGKGRQGRLVDKLEFGRRMSKFLTTEKTKAKRVNGGIERCVNIRALLDARATFDTALGTTSDWPDDSPASTQSAITF